jgi:nicotinamide mononucleotide adenylyltransferase
MEEIDNTVWRKNVHVESSLETKSSQYAMFVGRWQPLHESHIKLFQQAVLEGKNILICVRDGEVNDKNPYTAKEVKKAIKGMSKNWWTEDILPLIEELKPKVKVIIIPDICSVEFGRGVGYDIIEHIPPTEISDISATKIREQMRKDGKL